VELKLQKDIELRALGDRIHANIPYWRDLLEDYGVVPGTPDNCAQLMENKQHILWDYSRMKKSKVLSPLVQEKKQIE